MADKRDVLTFRDISQEEFDIVKTIYVGRIMFADLIHAVHIEEWGPVSSFFINGPKGYIFTKEYAKQANDVYNMELKEGDHFVVTYQRSGTTWTQELLWLVANNFDYEKAAAVPLIERYAFLEHAGFFNEESRKLTIEGAGDSENVHKMLDILATPGAKLAADLPSPRFLKTHLPISLLPPTLLDTAKVVYVARDPRDVAVSSYHHSKLFKYLRINAPLKDIWKAFTKDLFTLTPYFEHVKEAWALRNHPNMLFLFYEDLSKDLPGSMRRVADFLGKELTPDQIDKLCDHLNIKNFKNNKSVNCEAMRDLSMLDNKETFIRKGKTGGWRDYFDEEMERDAARWIADNLRDSDLRFPSMQD